MTLTRRSAFAPLATAIVSLVSADAIMQTLLAGDMIYNQTAPVGSQLPYITLGFGQENANNTFAAPGMETHQTLDIWTRKAAVVGGGLGLTLGADALWAIYDRLVALLHEQPLTLPNFRTVIGTLTMQATMVDPDGESLHGLAWYDLISRQTA